MSAGSLDHEHGAEHSDLVLAHALQAVPPDQLGVLETNLARCAACRREIAVLAPVVDALLFWPTDELRPSPSLRERLARRIAQETGRDFPNAPASPWVEPEWEEVAPGISCKQLAIDPEAKRVSMLVRLAPGTDYPPHRHGGVEELHLLQGELWIGDSRLVPGDYNRAEPGTVDHRVWSETGCTCVLVTSTRDQLR